MKDIPIISIDKNSPQPIAQQIIDNVSKMIFCGQLSPGEKLPTERDLSTRLNISRGTVKQAYSRLEQAKMIEIRQGSGSYVLANGQVLEASKKKEAAEVVVDAITRLQSMGLSDKEIQNLVNLRLSITGGLRKINIMVLSNNHEILSELEKQLSYLSSTSQFFFTLTFLTLENIQRSSDPLQTLVNYNLIITTSIDYAAATQLALPLRHKIIEATISPCTSTLVEIAALPRSARINIVYRTNTFLLLIKKTLISMGFKEDCLFPWQELEYIPACHFHSTIDAVINFNESPVYVNPDFHDANEEFTRRGGKLIFFEYQIDRSSLLHIEDRIQTLVADGGVPFCHKQKPSVSFE